MSPLFLFLLCAASGVVVPAPEDLALLLAGTQIAAGELSAGPAMVAGIAGILVRDSLFFMGGRLLGAGLFSNPWVLRLFGESRLVRARVAVAQRGNLAVLMGRAAVGFRAAAFLVAGAMGVPITAFVLWDLIGLVLMVPLVLTLGVVVGAPALAAAEWLVAQPALLALVIGLVGASVFLIARTRTGLRSESVVAPVENQA